MYVSHHSPLSHAWCVGESSHVFCSQSDCKDFNISMGSFHRLSKWSSWGWTFPQQGEACQVLLGGILHLGWQWQLCVQIESTAQASDSQGWHWPCHLLAPSSLILYLFPYLWNEEYAKQRPMVRSNWHDLLRVCRRCGDGVWKGALTLWGTERPRGPVTFVLTS